MKVSRQFLIDFAYIAQYYDWTAADIEDAKSQTRESPELKAYWSELANAHRSGYRQTNENNFQTLQQWKLGKT